jgi:hypothetical protein
MEKIIYEEIRNSGLILKDPSPENYSSGLFGKVGIPLPGILSPVEPPIIFPDGKGWYRTWYDYDYQELQFNQNFDTWSCVIFSIAKALCLYIFKVYGIKYTISEMYNAFYAGVREGVGTTIEDGMESFRNYGWIEDKEYPLTPETTARQYYAQPPASITLKAKGKLQEWTIYWNVIPAVTDALKSAYRRTPVVMTGYAWAMNEKGVYVDGGRRANHAFLGLEILPNSNNVCSDTYPKDFQYVEQSQIGAGDLLKELDKGFAYGSAHTVWAVPKNPKSLKLTLIEMFKKIKRDIHGGLWFVKVVEKDGKKFTGKQKLENWLDFSGAVIDEIGCETIKDEKLNTFLPFKFFGK